MFLWLSCSFPPVPPTKLSSISGWLAYAHVSLRFWLVCSGHSEATADAVCLLVALGTVGIAVACVALTVNRLGGIDETCQRRTQPTTIPTGRRGRKSTRQSRVASELPNTLTGRRGTKRQNASRREEAGRPHGASDGQEAEQTPGQPMTGELTRTVPIKTATEIPQQAPTKGEAGLGLSEPTTQATTESPTETTIDLSSGPPSQSPVEAAPLVSLETSTLPLNEATPESTTETRAKIPLPYQSPEAIKASPRGDHLKEEEAPRQVQQQPRPKLDIVYVSAEVAPPPVEESFPLTSDVGQRDAVSGSPKLKRGQNFNVGKAKTSESESYQLEDQPAAPEAPGGAECRPGATGQGVRSVPSAVAALTPTATSIAEACLNAVEKLGVPTALDFTNPEGKFPKFDWRNRPVSRHVIFPPSLAIPGYAPPVEEGGISGVPPPSYPSISFFDAPPIKPRGNLPLMVAAVVRFLSAPIAPEEPVIAVTLQCWVPYPFLDHVPQPMVVPNPGQAKTNCSPNQTFYFTPVPIVVRPPSNSCPPVPVGQEELVYPGTYPYLVVALTYNQIRSWLPVQVFQMEPTKAELDYWDTWKDPMHDLSDKATIAQRAQETAKRCQQRAQEAANAKLPFEQNVLYFGIEV
eukprot:GHVT01049546.1.p1 GENE.GHVT01049546.1~~GHVT01049546.1.p1  ORF type:complete len:633 (+),score=93.69 GHVT01049546.1:520-2418(+)